MSDDRNFISQTEQRERKAAAQIHRLAQFLRDEIFEQIRSASYSNRCMFEKIRQTEEERLKVWGETLKIDAAGVVELSEILNSKVPDVQALASACSKYGLESHMALLLALFSEAKQVGIAEVMSKRGKTKSRKATERKVQMGIRWLCLEYEDPRRYGIKTKVAVQLAEEFDLEVKYVQRLMKGENRDENEELFPDGVDAARRAAGLPPRLPLEDTGG